MLTIAGFGLATGTGRTRAAILAAQKAKSAGFRGHRQFFDASFNPAICVFETVDKLARFNDRVADLVADALADCASSAPHPVAAPLVAHVILPPPDAGLAAECVTQAGQDIQAQITAIFASGIVDIQFHAGAQAGLGHAIAASLVSRVPNHLIIAADSFCDRARMDHLLVSDRLMSQKNPWGLVPGEAAGALWLRHGAGAGLGRIAGSGMAQEDVTEFAEAETDYRALSLAVRQACQGVGTSSVSGWWADANNSRYRASEVSHAVLRAAPFWLAPGLEPDYPALGLGDCGAASGMTALHCVLASEVSDCLITLGAPDGTRCAIRIARKGP